MVLVTRGQNRRRLRPKRRRRADGTVGQRSPAALAAGNGFVGPDWPDGGGWRGTAALPARRGRAGSWRAAGAKGVCIARTFCTIALLTHPTSPPRRRVSPPLRPQRLFRHAVCAQSTFNGRGRPAEPKKRKKKPKKKLTKFGVPNPNLVDARRPRTADAQRADTAYNVR